MDAATLGALGTVAVGVAAAAGALIGKRGENRAQQAGAVFGGYSTLVDNLQEERNKIGERLVENERLLAAAYAELAGERATNVRLQTQIETLTAENERLRQRLSDLGGRSS